MTTLLRLILGRMGKEEKMLIIIIFPLHGKGSIITELFIDKLASVAIVDQGQTTKNMQSCI